MKKMDKWSLIGMGVSLIGLICSKVGDIVEEKKLDELLDLKIDEKLKLMNHN